MQKGALLIFILTLVGFGCFFNQKTQPSTVSSVTSVDKSIPPIIEEPVKVDVLNIEQDDALVEKEQIIVGKESIVDPLSISLKSGNFFFEPPLIEVKLNQKITITVAENTGLHTFVIDEIGLRAQLVDGAQFTFTAPNKAGDYAFYCDIGEHRALGMEGILRVSE